MLRFFAIAWTPPDTGQREGARQVAATIGASDDWRSYLDLPGLRLWCTGIQPGITEVHLLPRAAGAIVGTVFEHHGGSANPSPYAAFCSELATRIVESGGNAMLASHWGHFVTFVRHEDGRVSVLRDPTGGLDCYHIQHQGTHIYCSDVEDAVALRVLQFSPDWPRVVSHMVMPTMRTEATALVGVRELIAGQRDNLSSSGVSTSLQWHPAEIAQAQIENRAEAVEALRNLVTSTVQTWASLFDCIVLLLSGGIDSSIVAACLVDLTHQLKVISLTQYLPGPGGGDEREFARLAAQMLDSEHIERHDNVTGSLRVALSIARSARPSMYLSLVNGLSNLQLAREQGAQAIFNGVGGDAFFYEAREHGLSDYLCRHHPYSLRAVQIARDSARLQGTSLWTTIQRARRGAEQKDRFAESLKYAQLLTPQATEVAQRHRDSTLHPWLRHGERIPPGTAHHIAMLAQPMSHRPPLASPDDPPHIPALSRHQLYELCLRIPPDLHTSGGWTRAIAREAFKHRVPHQIIERRDKGHVGTATEQIMWSNRDFALEILADGILVREGWLNRARVIEALSDAPTRIGPTEVIRHLSTEIWLRRWTEGQRSAAA